MNTVVELRKRAIQIPPERQAAVLILFKPPEFFHQVNLELRADPHAKLESNVRMSIGSAVASGCRLETDCAGLFHPFLHADFVVVQTGLASNYGEFAIIKIGVENRLPNSKELHRVAVSKPVGDEEIAVLGLQHVGERNVVAILARQDGYGGPLDLDAGAFGLLLRSWLKSHPFQFGTSCAPAFPI